MVKGLRYIVPVSRPPRGLFGYLTSQVIRLRDITGLLERAVCILTAFSFEELVCFPLDLLPSSNGLDSRQFLEKSVLF